MTSTQRAGLSRRAKALRALPATALATATGTATTLLLAGTAWAAGPLRRPVPLGRRGACLGPAAAAPPLPV